VRQLVILEKPDFETLRRGGLLTIGLGTGQHVDIVLEGARVSRNGGPPAAKTPRARPASTPTPKPKPKKKYQGLTALRGDCPYCDDAKNVLLSPHIRSLHKGKPIPYAGEGYKCRYCAQRFPTVTGVLRHMQRSHKDKPPSTRESMKKTPASPKP
jgi:hypothetical protein